MTISNIAWQPVSNELNTFADKGIEPLSEFDIRTRLITDVLFMDNVVIPAQSLLCNPAIYEWIRDKRKRELLEWFISNRKLTPLSYKEGQSFEDLLALLWERKTVALKWLKKGELETVAEELDNIFSEKRREPILVSEEDIRESKTQLSLTFINQVDKIHPGLASLREELVQEAKYEIDNVGAIHGSWWNTLSQRNKLFIPFDKKLKEIGTIVFDFAHASAVNRLLIGHPYHRTVLGIGKLTEHVVKRCEVEIESGIFDLKDVDATIFIRDIVEKMDAPLLDFLQGELKEEREEYFKSVNKLFRQPTEDTLREVKFRMDDYINRLGSSIQATALKSYIQKLNTIKHLKSSLQVWQCFDSVMCTLCTGGTACGVGEYVRSGGGVVGLILMFFGPTVISSTRGKIKNKKKSITEETFRQQTELDKLRPVSFTINPTIPKYD